MCYYYNPNRPLKFKTMLSEKDTHTYIDMKKQCNHDARKKWFEKDSLTLQIRRNDFLMIKIQFLKKLLFTVKILSERNTAAARHRYSAKKQHCRK